MSGAAGWPDPDLTADPAEKARSKFVRRKKDQLLKLSSLFLLLLSKGQGQQLDLGRLLWCCSLSQFLCREHTAPLTVTITFKKVVFHLEKVTSVPVIGRICPLAPHVLKNWVCTSLILAAVTVSGAKGTFQHGKMSRQRLRFPIFL